MKKLKRTEATKEESRKLKVAAYCRVSTKFESQQSSIDLQISNYKTVIQSNPQWEYAGVYFDYGSGLRQIARRCRTKGICGGNQRRDGDTLEFGRRGGNAG